MKYLSVYEWAVPHQVRTPGITPFVVVNIFHDTPEEQGEEAAAELARRRRGERALMPFWLLTKEIRHKIPEIPGRADIDPLTVLEDGIDPRPSIEFLTPLSRKLRERGVTLDLIAADVEDGVGLHQIMPAWDDNGAWERVMDRIYSSPKAYARMPDKVKRLRPRDFNPWNEEGRRAINSFNEYAQSLVVKAIREVFIESRLFHDERGRQPFRISNWLCNRPCFPIKDLNGWPVPPLAVDSVSSPALYLNGVGHLYRGRAHEGLWAGFLHCINIARSCLGTRSGSVIPWISSPRYYVRNDERTGAVREGYDSANEWLWRELIAHLVRGGCREFLFWNADSDRVLAHKQLAETMRFNDRPYSRRMLPEVELDVDEVTTRGYTTRYSDYLAAKERAEVQQAAGEENGEGTP